MAEFVRRWTREALIAFAVGAVAILGGRGLAEAGVPTVWLWAWGVAAFVAFAGGLSCWAVRVSRQWTAIVDQLDERTTRRRPAPAMVSTETVTYSYAAGLALLLNLLATGGIASAADLAGYLTPYLQAVALCNLAGYVLIIGALRNIPTDGADQRRSESAKP